MFKLPLFILYRLVERLTNIRLESYFGFIIFRYFFNYKVISTQIFDKTDKRSTWEELRLTDVDETIQNHVGKLLCVGNLSFENSMESSIRGINCIISVWQGVRDSSDQKTLNRYIKSCYFHTILCPDLYLKRKGVRLDEQSNNHRYYNLLFHQFYNIYFGKKPSFKALEEFVSRRLITYRFYDEGSSFYHYGVMDSLLKLRVYAHDNGIRKCFSDNFENMLSEAECHLDVFNELNFGDRDGTTVAPWMKRGVQERKGFQSWHNDRFSLFLFPSSFLCLRQNNWCHLGTQGHVHDDFGHVIYSSPRARLLDRGIYKYVDEPLYAKKKHHNFPLDRELPEINCRRRFERDIPRNKHIEFAQQNVKLRESGKTRSLIREMCLDNFCVDDYLECEVPQEVTINWRFFLTGDIYYGSPEIKSGTVINVGSDIRFELHPNSLFRVCESTYFPEYGQVGSCNVLLIRLRINVEMARKIKLLSVNFQNSSKAI